MRFLPNYTDVPMPSHILSHSLLFACTLSLSARANPVIEIWPEGKVPGQITTEQETVVPRNDGFTRITHVSRPTLTVFSASSPDGKPTPAVIVCPGGGYNYTVVDKEGSEIATWLNSAGITAIVLKYRTPRHRDGALQDAQRSIRIVRARAVEWKIDPKQLGIIGFSAGGHLAARTSTAFDKPSYEALDGIDQQSTRPDFALLVYPAYLDNGKGSIAPELNIEAKIPPTLIVHNEDDKSFVIGSKIYQAALEKANISHQFLLYPTGGHGYGMRCQGDAKSWPADTLKWLGSQGVTLPKR